ncbi:hypothetical protein ACJ41O_011131 [Fusarium nematophilum]
MLINIASLVFLQAAATLACLPPDIKRTSGDEPSPFVMGSHDPSDPATTSYFMNHVALNVNNLTRSLDFYKKVFGFRHVFTYHITSRFSVSYMAHSAGGKNGTGYQATEELLREKNNGEGRLELVHLNVAGEDIPGSDQRATTLSHLGIIVPNTTETQIRLEKLGVEIYKGVGEKMPSSGPLGNPFSLGDASSLTDEEFEAIQEGMTRLNHLNIFAADPDGNLLEILPLEEGNPFT